MKRIQMILVIAMLLLTASIPTFAAKPYASLTGGGNVDFLGGKETYSFSVIQLDEEGNARGNARMVWHYASGEESQMNPQGLFYYDADILYMCSNKDTGEVWLGGVVERSNMVELWGYEVEGLGFIVKLVDNGQGETDQIGFTWMTYGPSEALDYAELDFSGEDLGEYMEYLNDWTDGNITLH